MRQNVAMVDETGKLHQLILRNIEIGISFGLFVILSHRPSNAKNRYTERVHHGSFLPFSIIWRNGRRCLLTDVFIDTSKRTIGVGDYVWCINQLQYVKTWNFTKWIYILVLIFKIELIIQFVDVISLFWCDVANDITTKFLISKIIELGVAAAAQKVHFEKRATILNHFKWECLHDLKVY